MNTILAVGQIIQIALAVPMCILYEIGIFFAQIINRRRKPEPAGGENLVIDADLIIPSTGQKACWLI